MFLKLVFRTYCIIVHGKKLNNEEQFKLPIGYMVWCHECGRPPFNKTTEVEYTLDEPISMESSQLPIKTKKDIIPGIGFKSLKESVDHTRDVHRTWKG